MAERQNSPPMKGAVLLLGAPGVGKSLLGQALCAAHSRTIHAFVNVGQQLRNTGKVDQYFLCPTAARKAELQHMARSIVCEACQDLQQAEACIDQDGFMWPQVLLLECVKELDDAYMLTELLEHYNLPLLGVIYIPNNDATTMHLQHDATSTRHGDCNREYADRDSSRAVEKRQAKWQHNAAALLEYFSSLGVLVEVTASRSAPDADKVNRNTLAAAGYASCHGSSSKGHNSSRTCTTWLQAVGWCSRESNELRACRLEMGGKCVTATAIEPVVSQRLVTSNTERDTVLAVAANSTGLYASSSSTSTGSSVVANHSEVTNSTNSCTAGSHNSSKASSHFARLIAVPCQSITRPADARWVAVPGRYMVSLKCDGTRHLLISTGASAGHCYLLNRAGMLYKFQIAAQADTDGNGLSSCSLPAGTVLDGELVWLEQGSSEQDPQQKQKQGFFLVFDALAVGSQRVWQLPLQQRLEAIQQLQLTEAAAADEQVSGLETAASSGGSAASALHAAAATSSAAGATGSSAAAGGCVAKGMPLTLSKKQQAADITCDAITLLFKAHYDVSAAALQQLEAQRQTYPFPTDGLVFTPKAMPYVLGLSQLLIKWQPQHQAAADIIGTDLHKHIQSALCGFAGDRSQIMEPVQRLPADLVYECTSKEYSASAADFARQHGWSRRAAQAHANKKKWRAWQPQSVRWDKAKGNSRAALDILGKPSTALTHQQLIQAIWEVESFVGTANYQPLINKGESSSNAAAAATAEADASSSTACPHPARVVPFDELYESVMKEVSAGTVERTVDSSGSGLEIFCYCMDLGPPSSATAAMCRGLVLHPASSTVVATPFVRFGGLETLGQAVKDEAEVCSPNNTSSTTKTNAGSSSSSYSSGGMKTKLTSGSASILAQQMQQLNIQPDRTNTKQAPITADGLNLQLYRSWHKEEAAYGSVKVDGSFIIAFMWEGHLKVTTRRRMNSEQALWSFDWLTTHANLDAMQPGWTYMFEAVYHLNRHVVQYPFEGLVLLDAVNPQGFELPDAIARQQLAQQLGVMAVPSIVGVLPELIGRLQRGCATKHSGDETCNTLACPSSSGSSRGVKSRTASHSGRSGDKGSSNSEQQDLQQVIQPGSFEGWVVKSGQSRYKLVQQQFERCSYAAGHLLHPLMVWDAVFCGKSRAQLAEALPSHFVAELDAILSALDCAFTAVHTWADTQLQKAWLLAAGSMQALLQCPAQVTPNRAAALARPDSDCSQGTVAAPGSDTSATQSSFAAGVFGTPVSASVADQFNKAAPVLLEYAIYIGTTSITSMFHVIISSYRSFPCAAPALRGLLLECIRPSPCGELLGYTPSPAFQQTYAKGWAKGPQGDRRVSVATSLILEKLTDQAMMGVLSQLQGVDVGAAMRVCRSWLRLIQGDPDLKTRATASRMSRRQFAGGWDNDSDRDWDRYEYGYGYSSPERYGSP